MASAPLMPAQMCKKMHASVMPLTHLFGMEAFLGGGLECLAAVCSQSQCNGELPTLNEVQ